MPLSNHMKKYSFRFYNFNTKDSIHHSLKLFGVSVWVLYYTKTFTWFKICGYGILSKHVYKHGLSFSERHGYAKGIIIKDWYFRLIK